MRHHSLLTAALIMLGLVYASGRLIAAEAAPPATGSATLTGEEITKAFESRYGIWFVGAELPAGLAVDLPEKTGADEAVARLRAALNKYPGTGLRVIGAAGVGDEAAMHAAVAALGYRVEEVPGSEGKVYVVRSMLLPAQAGAAASAPATKPGDAADTATMLVRYENATFDTVMTDMARQFGFVFVVPGAISTRVTIQVPTPVKAREAVELLRTALLTQGNTILPAADNPKVMCVLPMAWGKVVPVPVRYGYGMDESKIPQTDEIVMQIIPLKNRKAAEYQTDLNPFTMGSPLDFAVDERHNCLLLTEKSATVRRLMEFFVRTDVPPSERNVIEYRQLLHAQAVDVAKTLNAKYAPASTAPATRQWVPGQMYFDADERTNAVIVNGPASKVAEALKVIQTMDADAGK